LELHIAKLLLLLRSTELHHLASNFKWAFRLPDVEGRKLQTCVAAHNLSRHPGSTVVRGSSARKPPVRLFILIFWTARLLLVQGGDGPGVFALWPGADGAKCWVVSKTGIAALDDFLQAVLGQPQTSKVCAMNRGKVVWVIRVIAGQFFLILRR
jgi:hypothetical protein